MNERIIQISSISRIIVQEKEFKGKKFLDVRREYMTDDDKWAPTRKGIMIGKDHIGDTIKEMIEVARSMGVRSFDR